jgi:hypothetical protein
MIVAWVAGGVIVGMFIGRFFREPDFENDCPQLELGYRCRGDLCDHRKSELYKAKAVMAEEQEKSYWRGGPHA